MPLVVEGRATALAPVASLPLFQCSVSAGFPSPADDFQEASLDLNSHLVSNPAATFFVKVSGDSMIGAGIYPNDLLIVDRSLKPRDGSIIIAVLNGELTLKRLRQFDGKLFLFPENRNYRPIQITEGMDFQTWGVVRHAVHSI